MKAKAEYAIEIAHDIVNPFGGVYTVISTKAREMKKIYKNNYFTIGPYYHKNAKHLFSDENNNPFKSLFSELRGKGIECHWGTWLIPGKPKTILVDYTGRMDDLQKIKKRYQKDYGIQTNLHNKPFKQFNLASPTLDVTDLNLQYLWGDSVIQLVNGLLEEPDFKGKKGILQFHFSDGSLPLMADLVEKKKDVGLIVTSHSTRIGRAMCSAGEDFYSKMDKALKEKKSITYKTVNKYDNISIILHEFELLAVKYADVFTAVSDITGRESEYILGRGVDIVTPNGIDTSKFPTIEESTLLHKKYKEKLLDFLEAYFLPYYNIDFSKSLIFLISGRYEFRNKGYDIFIEALNRLNEKLNETSGMTVFAFIFVYNQNPPPPDNEVLANLAAYDGVREFVYDKMEEMKDDIITNLVHRQKIRLCDLLEEDFFQDAKRQVDSFAKHVGENPPFCVLKTEGDDELLDHIRDNNLLNREEDRVKVIYYPLPVSVGDGFLQMSYEHAIAGGHVGVFPSYYEPWGYTPQESAARGLLAVTTDLAGFGEYMLGLKQDKDNGVFVTKRRGKSKKQEVEELAELLHGIVKLNRGDRINLKFKAKKVSDATDWRYFADYYVKAHNLALEKAGKRV
jgi:glycogen(starch) synthase